MKKSKEFLFKSSLIFALIFSIFLSSFSAFARDCEEIRQNTLRLHVLAASDSEEDQNLKLMARDKILEESGELFLSAKSSEECKKIAEENMERFLSLARNVIEENGYDYKASGEVVEMFFSNRTYDDVTLPAGRYTALRIIIGEGKGKNWWCVLFPPLCIPSCTKTEESTELLSPVTGGDAEIQVKLWIVEVFERIKEIFIG